MKSWAGLSCLRCWLLFWLPVVATLPPNLAGGFGRRGNRPGRGRFAPSGDKV